MALDRAYLVDLETRWRAIIVDDYAAYSAAKNQWWRPLTKVLTTGSKKEMLSWIVQTALLESQGPLGGNWNADDLGFAEAEFTPEFVGKLLKLRKAQLEDLQGGLVGGEGVALGTSWMRQMAGQFAYWPQRQIASLLKSTTLKGYDGQVFFSTTHPYDVNDASRGTYGNRIPNVPLSTDSATALASLKTVFATIGAIKMPNGNDPRYLRPVGILAGPTLYPSVVQVTDSKFISLAATAGNTTAGGSGDIEGVMRSMGYGQPILVPELAGFESETTYFVIAAADGVPNDDMAGFVYLQRQPFGVRFYTGAGGGDGVDAILGRANELEWQAEGRNITGYGHPYRIFKCTAGA